MDEYLGWFLDLTYWHWLALGVTLGGIEMLTLSFFLIFPAISAILLAGVLLFDPALDWRLQLLAFAIGSILSTVLGRSWLRRYRDPEEPMKVNVRSATYIGRRVRLDDALEHGEGRLRIDGTWWNAATPDREPVEAATLVEIISADGATLHVRPVDRD